MRRTTTDPHPAAQPAASSDATGDERAAQMDQLRRLHDQGVLTEAEFSAATSRLTHG